VPIYLPPISRRQFLKGSIAAGALALAGGCATSSRSFSGQSWALVSDIHVAANPNKIEDGTNMTRNLTIVREEILTWPEKPSAVLVNGDLAFNNGEAGDYKAVGRLVRPWREQGLPIYMGMGNHDNRERFWKTLHGAKREQPPLLDRQVALVETDVANWFILDSLIQTRKTPGLLGGAQLDWLEKALDDNTDKPAIIAIHHHPGQPGATGALEDADALFEILRPRKQVKAYFFGHTHHWRVTQDPSGIHLINLPPTAYVFQQGQPNGWVHLNLQSDGARLELRCIDRTHKDHGQIVQLAWRA
jgi:Icc protein